MKEDYKVLYDKETEVIDDLQVNNLKIIQNKFGFKFGIDAVLLSNFVDGSKTDKIIEFGTGTCIIPILLAGKYGFVNIHTIEVQKKLCEMSRRSVEMNKMSDKIDLSHIDLKQVNKRFAKSSFDIMVSNPPYKHLGSGILNLSDNKAISRHEVLCNFEDVISSAKYLLKNNGKVFLVHRPERLVDIIYIMRKYKIEPKFIQMVHSKIDNEPKLVLIKAVNNGKSFLKILKPLIVYKENGEYTDELRKIYCKE